MAIVANTQTRYGQIGLRERLSNIIYDITPMETPVVTAMGKSGTDQTIFEWQTDVLGAVDTGNAHIEGDDISSFPATTPTSRVGNYTQISRKLVIVSGTVDRVNKAGRASELAREVSRRGREMKRDFEGITLENLAGDAGGTATARQTATLGAWVKTNVDKEAGGGNPTYTSGVPSATRTDGTPRALTETMFKAVAQSMWTNGADLNAVTVYAGAHNKEVISGFSGVVTRNFDISNTPKPTAVIAAVDVYVTDFGTVRIAANRFQRGRDLWFIDPEYLSMRVLRPFQTIKLAKTGDAEKRMLLQEWGIQVSQEAGLGLVADLTVA